MAQQRFFMLQLKPSAAKKQNQTTGVEKKERKREERDSEDYCREEEKYLAKYILHR